ncbi:MAG TPA: thioredoxin family protein [Aliidongia sp.]|nr:thioredoxin family protein [Aliidongia sp.]
MILAAAHPYDENEDAGAAIAAAQRAAQIQGKKVLVTFGANWCPDCRALGGALALSGVRKWVDAHYVLVEVDVGRFDKNLDLASRLGLDIKGNGIPETAVLAPSGAVLNAGDVMRLFDASTMTPQSVVDVLAGWAQPKSS